MSHIYNNIQKNYNLVMEFKGIFWFIRGFFENTRVLLKFIGF